MTQLISYVNPFAGLAPLNSITQTPKDIQVEIGKSNVLIDGFRNVMSLPMKLFLWNSNINSGNISPDVIEKVKNYLHSEGLHDVAVSVNQYKPQEVWSRIFTNPKTSFVSKLTMGMVYGLLEMLSFNKLTGIPGDHYNPASNTIHLFSNDAALALYECGRAKDFNSRLNPSLYQVVEVLPVVGPIASIFQRYLANNYAIQHIECHYDGELVRHSFKVLTPLLAFHLITSLKTQNFKITPIGFLMIVGLGHLIGRNLAGQYQEIRKV